MNYLLLKIVHQAKIVVRHFISLYIIENDLNFIIVVLISYQNFDLTFVILGCDLCVELPFLLDKACFVIDYSCVCVSMNKSFNKVNMNQGKGDN